MASLSEFLRERITEDEVLARLAPRTQMRIYTGRRGEEVELAAHCMRWQPNRVLDECAAKRAIVDLCAAPMVDITALGERQRRFVPGGQTPWGEPVLLALAAVYAAHRDYLPEWKA